MPEQIKILFLAANPTDISRIRIDEELRDVDERISIGSQRDRFELIPLVAVRPRDLRRGLLRYQPHILHFSGHGSTSGGIVLEGNDGQTKLVAAADLANLLSIIKDNLRVVVLNACYSALQASGIAETVDCTIGMNDKVDDKSAIIFSATFYESLAFGRSVDEAFNLGVNGLRIEGATGASIPTLLTKKGVDLAATFLTADKEEPSAPPPPPPTNQVTFKLKDTQVKNERDGYFIGVQNR